MFYFVELLGSFRFTGPVTVTCYDMLIQNPMTEVSNWLDMLSIDQSRLHCILDDPVGQFYRNKTKQFRCPINYKKSSKFYHGIRFFYNLILNRLWFDTCVHQISSMCIFTLRRRPNCFIISSKAFRHCCARTTKSTAHNFSIIQTAARPKYQA